MSAPRLARAAAKALAAREELIDRLPSAGEREETVDAIRSALALRARRREHRRWLVPLLTAAAAIVVVGATALALRHNRASVAVAVVEAPVKGVVVGSVHGAAFVANPGGLVPLVSGAPLAGGAQISTFEGDAVLTLRSGSKLDVERATATAIVDDGRMEMIDLAYGAVTSTVTKRGPAERFVVRTVEAEVEVRGTVFRVLRLRDAECGARTRVHVIEGRVVVRGAGTEVATLDPGGEWASPCERPEPTAPQAPQAPLAPQAPQAPPGASGPTALAAPPSHASAASAASPASPGAPVVRPALPAPEEARASTASDLAVQNALFADAMNAKSRGDTTTALRSLDELLDKYPRSPLREAAEAQRMMVLAGIDRPRAAGSAKQYLAKYPRGFARLDAEKIARDSQ